jgi:hypothetical protein
METHVRRSLAFILSLNLAAAVACAGEGAGPSATGPAPASPGNVHARALSPFHAAISWEAADGLRSLVERREEHGEWKAVAVLEPGTEHVLDPGLRPQTRYRYRVGASRAESPSSFSEEVAVETPASPLPEPSVEIFDPAAMQPGLTMLSIEDPDHIYEFSALVVMDREGRYLWMVGDERFLVISDFDLTPRGTLLIMTGSAMEEITASGERLWRFDDVLFHHDIDVTPWGTALGIIAYREEVGGAAYSSDALLEYDMKERRRLGVWPLGEVVYHEDICIPCFHGPEYFFGRDWTHANAVAFSEDLESVFISVRNLNRIYKVRLDRGTAEWIMGDGGDFGGGLFSHQHDPQPLGPGRMLLFDNGLHRMGADAYSRAVEIAYDEEARAAGLVWEYREEPDFYSSVGGDADRLPNGNTLVTDSMNARIIEVTPDCRRVWELTLPFPYRIYKAIRTSGFPR